MGIKFNMESKFKKNIDKENNKNKDNDKDNENICNINKENIKDFLKWFLIGSLISLIFISAFSLYFVLSLNKLF